MANDIISLSLSRLSVWTYLLIGTYAAYVLGSLISFAQLTRNKRIKLLKQVVGTSKRQYKK